MDQMQGMEDPFISAADMFLLERWQEDSPVSPEVQREKIFAEFLTLGVNGASLTKIILRQRGPPLVEFDAEERWLLNRVRRPATERFREGVPWLRTCYEPSREAAFSSIVSRLKRQLGRKVNILDNPAIYGFGADW
ncbi:uncharacterized protein P174DRAFT_425050 [Aspergillus novofumigatus IBT 16806]|uniref:Uncharacterized protein n=1 Tax=Aspergillus novofumigatus (strain IBT 16806) TaxID=1392255 RepID=A0A2I1BWY4_ASPN1|nr:uncharacterized protein P174DRAFT_425050 [Aspergillus novofumigatus IBT 16806]PKX89885.1 hypothetical protein P174DRAFT_425050 [Aspergillus novofumigatus IBT 16806]